MAILNRLDNRFPPTWDGVNPETGDPFLDDATQLRYMTGEDVFNYITDQRVQGDLAARDLALLANQKALVEYVLINSAAFELFLPATVIPANDSVLINNFTVPVGKKITLVACHLRVNEMYSLVADEDVFIEVIKEGSPDTVILTLNAASPVAWPTDTSGLTELETSGDFLVALKNDSGSEVSVSANLAIGLLDE